MKASTRPKIRRTAAIAVLLLSAALFGAVAPASAAPIKLGVYDASQGEVGAPEDARVLDSYAAMVGRKPDIVMDYSNVTDPLLTETEISNLSERGETPMVTWQLYQSGWGGATISLDAIAAGSYDNYLRSAANLAKSMPFNEILIRFAHEMNGNWYGWSGNPGAYVAAWRHVVTIFREAGATNVRWVWSPNVDYGSYPFAGYFPGDSWVDYVALDGYNWGTAGIGANKWQSLSQVFASSYKQLTQLSSKPVMIAETSSSEAGGSKADWIREGFLKAIPQEFPRVQAVVWFDRTQEEDWRIDSSVASLAAYREVVASTLYGGTVPPSQPANEEPVVEELEVTPPGEAPESAPTEEAAAPGTTPTESAPAGEGATESAGEVAGETIVPSSEPPKRRKEKRRGHGRSRLVSVRGRVFYRLSPRVETVRLTLRGPGMGGRSRRRSLMVKHPGRRGSVPLAKLLRGGVLPRHRYRVVARAVGHRGASKPRRARFRVSGRARSQGVGAAVAIAGSQAS